jgi:hypothetical protein
VRSFFEKKERTSIPYSNVFLGDSTIQLAANPLLFARRGVNLAISGGSALSADYFFKKFRSFQQTPKCVFFSSSYDWKNKYNKDFFEEVVFYDFIDFFEFSTIWWESHKDKAFPSTEYSYIHYMTKILLYKARLVDPPFNLIQDWLYQKDEKTTQSNFGIVYNMDRDRGFFSRDSNYILTESEFFRDTHQFYLKPFEEAHKSEDYYLSKLADAVVSAKAKFYYILLPIADAEYTEKALVYEKDRATHIHKLLANKSGVEVLEPFQTLNRSLMRDFSHTNKDGSDYLMNELKKIVPNCSGSS